MLLVVFVLVEVPLLCSLRSKSAAFSMIVDSIQVMLTACYAVVMLRREAVVNE